MLFYTYNGVFGKSPNWINIAIFYITALLVFLFEWWAFKKNRLAFAVICLIGMLSDYAIIQPSGSLVSINTVKNTTEVSIKS